MRVIDHSDCFADFSFNRRFHLIGMRTGKTYWIAFGDAGSKSYCVGTPADHFGSACDCFLPGTTAARIDANKLDVFLNTLKGKLFQIHDLEAGGGWTHILGLQASD